MDYENSLSQMNFKNTINNLFTKTDKARCQTRTELMKKIKNIILSNDNLNHHIETDFNFKQEYSEMNKTMKKFNKEQLTTKKLITELSKENQFFSKSYSNLVSSMITRLENKNIHHKTISEFNTKFKKRFPQQKEKNFFFQNPLLLTKKKDVNNFYLNRKEQDEEKDQYLTYSKKILNKINNQFPMLKINNIINEYNNKTNYRFNMIKRSKTIRKNMFNTFHDNKSLNQNNRDKRQSLTLRIDKNINFFSDKNTIKNDENKLSQINIFKKYKEEMKNIIDKDFKLKEKKEKQRLSLKEMNKTNTKNFKKEINKNNLNNNDNKGQKQIEKYRKSIKKKDPEFNALTDRYVKRNSNVKLFNKLISLGIKQDDLNNVKGKINKEKVKRIRKLKGSIHIKNIYNDYLNTRKIIEDYKKNNTIQLKYLYYSVGKKELQPFQKIEKENNKINKLGYNLFWTINK